MSFCLKQLSVAKFLMIALLTGVIVSMPCIAAAKGLKLVKTVYLEQGSVITPQKIVSSQNGGYIVVGDIQSRQHPHKQAWASEVDSEGNQLWRHVVEAQDNEFPPQYNGAISMPDGSSFLFGEMPFLFKKTGRGRAGLLTHVDKSGKQIFQKFIDPDRNLTGDVQLSNTGFLSCAFMQDGVIVVGMTDLLTDNPRRDINPARFLSKSYYIILSLDLQGNIRWEKLIPLGEEYDVVPKVSYVFRLSDGDWVFSLSSESSKKTRLLKLSKQGDVKNSVLLDGVYVFSRSQQGKNLTLVSVHSLPLIVLQLDTDFNEISRKQNNLPQSGYEESHLLQDGSLALFGTYYPSRNYTPQVTRIDENLRNRESLMLDENVGGNGTVQSAVVTIGDDNTFITVRSALGKAPTFHHPTEEEMDKIRMGVALQFIRFE